MYDKELKFNGNGRFRILIFTDIHAKPEESKKADLKNRDTFLFMNKAIEKLKPDLVLLGGDNCTDLGTDDKEENFRKVFERVSSPMIKHKVPFTTVLGNHEHDTDESFLQFVINGYETCPYAIVKNETPDIKNSLNHHITIKSSDGKHDAFNIWLMDSNNVITRPDRIVYDCVHRDQIEWYERTEEKIKNKNNGVTIPAILFQHIPVPEIYNVLRPAKWYEQGVAERGHDILHKYKFVKNNTCKGYLGEGPDCAYFNEGQFASWKKKGDIVGAFFGHDHMNDFDGVFDGITMGQCKTGGFWAYTDGCRTGARIIDIDETHPRNIETEMVHFKDLGLKSKSLGPIMKRITDRQSLTLHKLKWVALGTAAVTGGAVIVNKLKK